MSAVALFAMVALLGAHENHAARDARLRVMQSFEVLNRTLQLDNAVAMMEARHRAFLVGGEVEFLRRRDASLATVRALALELGVMLSDHGAQRAGLAMVLASINARYAVMRQSSDLAARRGLDAAQAQFHAFGSGSIDPIRAALRELGDAEKQLLSQRREASEQRALRFDRVLLYGTSLALLLLLGAGWTLVRQWRRTEALGAALDRTSAVQKAMLEHGGVMIIAVQPGGVISVFNRAASEALGYAAHELIGRQTPALFHDPAEIARRAADLAVELGRPVVGFEVFTAKPAMGLVDRNEWTYLRKNGSRFPVELAVTAVRGDDGQAYGFIGMALDLTRRRAAEEAVGSLNAELRAQTEALLVANRELEGFSYSVSHDLRAPLRHIEGYAAMLHQDAGAALEPEWRRYLERIGHSARRMGALIDALLSFSRLGRAQLRHQRVDMRALAEEVLGELGPRRGRIELGSLPDVAGDPALLRQVWANLLSNAVKYSAPRGEQARIDVHGSHAAGRAVFEVSDNGVGFDMRYRDKLFGVFQRLHPHDEFEGTGVGLAIVDRIVRRHGGSVDASAEPERGAVFRFELPMEHSAEVRA